MTSLSLSPTPVFLGFPGGSADKRIHLQRGRPGFALWVGKIPWRRKWQSTPALLPGKSHGQRILIGYSPWGRKESDTTERLHFLWPQLDFPEERVSTVCASLAEAQTQNFPRGHRAHWGFPGGSSGEEPTCQCKRCKRHVFDPWIGKIPLEERIQFQYSSIPA